MKPQNFRFRNVEKLCLCIFVLTFDFEIELLKEAA
jgi:hypothetical protein